MSLTNLYGSSHSYLNNLYTKTATAVVVAKPTYLNPNHITQPSPVPNFHAVPQVNHINDLTGFVMVPNKGSGIPADAVVIENNVDCSDPTHVTAPAPVPNATTNARPVYNHCGQLVGYIGQVVKNAQTPVATVVYL